MAPSNDGTEENFRTIYEKAKRQAKENARKRGITLRPAITNTNDPGSIPSHLAQSSLDPGRVAETVDSPTTQIKEEFEKALCFSEITSEGPRPDTAVVPLETANRFAGLKSAKKRKRPSDDSVNASPELSSTGENVTESSSIKSEGKQPHPKRPFAPVKKPAKVQKSTISHAELVNTRTTKYTSEWYERINMKQKYNRSDLQNLKFITSLIRDCESAAQAGDELRPLFSRLRQKLHQLEFYDFLSDILIKTSKLLEAGGLPSIFDNIGGVNYPWDLRADSEALHQKWLAGVIDPHLLRGIDTKEVRGTSGKPVKTRSLQKDYPRKVSCNYIGQGKLQNGQWWPLQICAMRDGAHGEIEAGIHGQPSKGAYSIVLSGGGYADIDDGDTLKYCGTSGVGGKPTAGTEHLKNAFILENPVRVLRSYALAAKNKYRPSKGLRYDGLYSVVDFEILDKDTAMHRFSLRRCQGQDPIRFKDEEQRPTDEELRENRKIRALLGYLT